MPVLRLRQLVYTAIPLIILLVFTFHSRRTSPVQIPDEVQDQLEHPIITTAVSDALPNFTTIPGDAHVHGFTVLDQLYVRQGTLYIVTDDPSQFPRREFLLSSGKSMGSSDMEATNEHLRFINRKEANTILGEHVARVQGFTMILWEDRQFMVHLYHFWGEIILGAWRVYSHLSGAVDLPLPTLFILPHVDADAWRDPANVVGPYMRAAFPNAAIETSAYWKDLIKLNATFVFDRVMLADRHTAHQHPWSARWFKMIAGTMNVTVPANFWRPVRNAVVQTMLGHIPAPPDLPVVTYISRQQTSRRLIEQDHNLLVRELLNLQNEGICKVQVLLMERLSMKEQVELVARSTIIIGVHGNGLTNQLWMPPSPHSAVIEIFYPPGYTFDYEILARNMGHRHYAIHNDTVVTFPPGQFADTVVFPDGFHGSSIPVYGPAAARLVKKILSEGHS